jgi:hypothetical protein
MLTSVPGSTLAPVAGDDRRAVRHRHLPAGEQPKVLLHHSGEQGESII